MEIEVGDYIRTTEKGIFKIGYIDNNKTVNRYLGDNGHDVDNEGDRIYTIIKTTDIAKHSKNIIDLIEERRYCNDRRPIWRKYVLYVG